jgi:putative ABC transport system permease protein
MGRPDPKVPRLPLALLRRLIQNGERETLLAELIAEYRDDAWPALGPFRAPGWVWRGSGSLAAAFLWQLLRRGRARDVSVILDARRYRRRSRAWGATRERSGRLESVGQDIRHGTRSLLRRPAFTVAALLTIAVGIGANTSIFTLLHATILRPLPFSEADRLVVVYQTMEKYGLSRMGVSPPDLRDWQQENRTLQSISPYRSGTVSLLGTGEPERLEATWVGHDLFETLGVHLGQGREFIAGEESNDMPGVVVLGHGLWQRRFGGQAEVLGASIDLDGRPHQVIGIAPPDFRFPDRSELFLPLRLTPEQDDRDAHMLWAVARLVPGVSIDEARADLENISLRLAEQYPETNEGLHGGVTSLGEVLYGELRVMLLVFYIVVTLVLLLACANTANLMLALFSTRRSELAIRASLGSGRGRLVRQLLTESLLLAAVGGSIGLGLGLLGRDLVLGQVPIEIPPYLRFDTDLSVLLSSALIILLTGILFGTLPALGSASPNLAAELSQGNTRSTGGRRQSRLRRGLVVFEVTLTVIVLTAAGLILSEYVRFSRTGPGFEPENVLQMHITLPSTRYPDASAQATYFRTARERLRALPGVEEASAVVPLPLGSLRWGRYFSVEGAPVDPDTPPIYTTYWIAQDGYFRTMGLPLLQGRDFTPGDQLEGAAPVVIVNETLARRIWPGEEALGKRIKWGPPDSDRPWMEVVGVVADINERTPGEANDPGCYVPFSGQETDEMYLVVKTRNDPSGQLSSFKSAIWTLDPDLPIYDVQTVPEFLHSLYWQIDLGTWALVVFSIIALVLAAVGIYGVISYSVSQRTREVGIRIALGAGRRDIVRMIAGQVGRLAGLGMLLGLLVGFAIVYVVGSQLFGDGTRDLRMLVVVAAVMGGTAFLSGWLPARKAARTDVMAAVRQE